MFLQPCDRIRVLQLAQVKFDFVNFFQLSALTGDSDALAADVEASDMVAELGDFKCNRACSASRVENHILFVDGEVLDGVVVELLVLIG